MELISMVEFVLQQEKCLENILAEKLPVIKLASSYDKIVNYANFLKQPLKLSMFVPCVNGVVLKEPKQTVFQDAHFDIDEMNNYHEAKEKVLFKDNNWSFITIREYINLNYTIEVFSAVERNVELTESAIKQIGINL